MVEDVKPEIIKKTQETLGKFVKKPTLTEKLLKKPPFRFLHDICTSVTKETAFFEGVLNEEDKFENIKDKEGKILFLQKVIAAVEAAGGVKLGVKPNKVVAGLEATKTNEFLQALGKVLEKQSLQQPERKSSKTALSFKAKSTKKAGKDVKEEPPDIKKSSGRTSKKTAESLQNEISDDKNRKNGMTAESLKKKRSGKKDEEAALREGEVASKEKHLSNGRAEETEEEIRKSTAIGAGESVDVPDVEPIVGTNSANEQGDHNQGAKREVGEGGQPRQAHTGKHKHRRLSLRESVDPSRRTCRRPPTLTVARTSFSDDVADRTKTIEETSNETKGVNADDDGSIGLERKSELQNKTAPNIPGQWSNLKRDADPVREGTSLISRPRTGIRLTTARPASARPAAPRIRDRGDVVVSEEVMKPASGGVQVIVDEDAVDEKDEEDLISLETTNDAGAEEPAFPLSTENHAADHEYGHLVEQILEVQRELEDETKFPEQEAIGRTEIEWELDKKRVSTNREIEKLRGNIQGLTRTANPLGKLLDFFQEDFEIVQKEWETWRDRNASHRLQIVQEKIVTEQYVEPLKVHLKEIQKNIDEQLDQISMVKANIIRNNEKISKLLSGM